jgi:MFS family permease
MVSGALVGLILGPIYGTISVGIGSVLAMIAFPAAAIISIFTPLAPMAGALTAGAVMDHRPWVLYFIFDVAFLLFIVGPIGYTAAGFLWLHCITFAISFLFVVPRISTRLRNGLELSESTSVFMVALAYWLTGFCALMADSLVGSTLYQYYAIWIGWDATALAGIYLGTMFVYPVERGIASVVLAVIAVATSRALASAHLSLPLIGHQAQEQAEFLGTEQ